MCSWGPRKPEDGTGFPGLESSNYLVVRTELGSSTKATSALHHLVKLQYNYRFFCECWGSREVNVAIPGELLTHRIDYN